MDLLRIRRARHEAMCDMTETPEAGVERAVPQVRFRAAESKHWSRTPDDLRLDQARAGGGS